MTLGLYRYESAPSIPQGVNASLELLPENPDDYAFHPLRNEAEFLVVRQGLVNAHLLDSFPRVRWIQLLNSGYEQVDLGLLKRRKIRLTNARSVYGKTIAEDVIAKVLFLARGYAKHFNNQAEHNWIEAQGNLDLYEKTLGILGAGNIGREVALRAAAFNLTVLGYDPYIQKQEGFSALTGLNEVLSASDFVVLCLPVTDETRDIINEKTLATMKSSAFLINVARGDIVDEDALVSALRQGVIRGAAIDVCKQEPLPLDSVLWETPNLLITPHQAAYGDLMRQRMCALVEKNIKLFLSGEPLLDTVLQ
jgi:phosphoglycerate dehydrogenase-like enzyme